MSEAREAKQREWRCNIFSGAADARPMFDRKKRQEVASREGSGVRDTFAHAVNEGFSRSRSQLGHRSVNSTSNEQMAAGTRNLTKTLTIADQLMGS